jgi:hypothetical protein
MCDSSFKNVINKFLPTKTCGKSASRSMQRVTKLTNQMTIAKDRVMQRMIKSAMRSRNTGNVPHNALLATFLSNAQSSFNKTESFFTTENKQNKFQNRTLSRAHKLVDKEKINAPIIHLNEIMKLIQSFLLDKVRPLTPEMLAAREEKQVEKDAKRLIKLSNDAEKAAKKAENLELRGAQERERIEKEGAKNIKKHKKEAQRVKKSERQMGKSAKKELKLENQAAKAINLSEKLIKQETREQKQILNMAALDRIETTIETIKEKISKEDGKKFEKKAKKAANAEKPVKKNKNKVEIKDEKE